MNFIKDKFNKRGKPVTGKNPGAKKSRVVRIIVKNSTNFEVKRWRQMQL